MLDVCEETHTLFVDERRLRTLCREEVGLIIVQRAAYWKQRGKFYALKEDDANTKYFHARSSCRAW
jgi:hypothetical protein